MSSRTPGFLCVFTRAAPSRKGAEVTVRAFLNECKEAHKSRRTFLDGAGVSMHGHQHYIPMESEDTAGNGSRLSESPRTCLDLYELEDIEPLLTGAAIMGEGGDGPLEVHSFTYKSLGSHRSQSVSEGSPAFLGMTSCNVSPSNLDAFNKWYQNECIPSMSVNLHWSGTIRGSQVLASADGIPQPAKYAAIHRFQELNGAGQRLDDILIDRTSEKLRTLAEGDVTTTLWTGGSN